MATLRKQFAQRIKTLRSEQGYTQEAFADKCGFARTYMSRIETGGANPSLHAINTLACALDMSIAQLLTFPEDTPSV